MLKAIFFDLDNTLYDQSLFYDSAFSAVAHYLSGISGIDPENVFNRLWGIQKEKGSLYKYLFDDIIAYFRLDSAVTNTLIKIFHFPLPCKIELFDGVKTLLQKLKSRYFLGIITNGNAKMQAHKIDCLNIAHLFDTIIYTSTELHPKPSPYCYTLAVRKAECRTCEALYVGDNPLIDFQGPYSLGMRCAMIRFGEFSSKKLLAAELDFQFNDYAQFEKKLESFG